MPFPSNLRLFGLVAAASLFAAVPGCGPVQAVPEKKPRSGYKTARLKLARAFAAVEKAEKEIPREGFDVAARARAVGSDPDKLFAFVCACSPELYPGVLRGPQGTLVSGGGNAADKALLLAELLRQHKHPVRFAFGQLP